MVQQAAQRSSGSAADAEGFTVQLALVDAIPVLEFAASMVCIAVRFRDFLFIVGALCCALAGCCKVAWKLLLATSGKDVGWLASNFLQRMLTGFALMLVAVVLNAGSIDFSALLARVTSLPAAICFAAAIALMVVLCVLRAKLDQHSARSNWIEQLVNIAMQTTLLAGILLV